MLLTLPLTLTLTAALGAGPADEPITRKNWSTHPKIEAVRAVFQQTEDAIKAGKLKHQEQVDCSEGPVTESRAADRDPAGVIRKLNHEFGSSDSAYNVDLYYDERGRLRFVYAQRGAVNESTGEFRIYFDEDGKKLWTDLRKKGPGYTWMPDFPERWVEKDAEAALKKAPLCK